MGVKNLSKDKLAHVIRIVELMYHLLKNSAAGQQTIGHFVSKAAYILIEKFSQVLIGRKDTQVAALKIPSPAAAA